MRLLALPLALALLLAGCAGSPSKTSYADREPDGEMSDRGEIPENAFIMPPFGAHVPIHVEAKVTVESGGAIDVWIGMKAQCDRYGYADFAPAAAKLNFTSGVIEADLPAGDACLIIDNANFGEGKAWTQGPVNVTYTIRVWERK